MRVPTDDHWSSARWSRAATHKAKGANNNNNNNNTNTNNDDDNNKKT